MNEKMPKSFDVAILGGGILGTSIAYWLSTLYDGSRVAVIEKENRVAPHTSSRNTGVIHRPFYLDPKKKKIFAQAAQISYELWKSYAKEKNLPWNEVETLEIAFAADQVKTLEKYKKFSLENGMRDDEVELLTPEQVKKIEPNVKCAGAILCKTDTAVSYGVFTEHLRQDAETNGVRFLLSSEITRIEDETNGVTLYPSTGEQIQTKFLINCAGGNAVDIAHMMGAAADLTDLHFRGEYWVIDPSVAHLAKRNIYSVPRHTEFPFLDPHWIVRWNGQVEIGPSAVPISDPYLYKGIIGTPAMALRKLFEKPFRNKVKLLVNPGFLSLAWGEWKSSLIKKEMARRVQEFLPSLRVEHLIKRGAAGIRSSVIDKDGNFAKEALEIYGPKSLHILNYNSPGATGAPAFAAHIVQKLINDNKLQHIPKHPNGNAKIWDFSETTSCFENNAE